MSVAMAGAVAAARSPMPTDAPVAPDTACATGEATDSAYSANSSNTHLSMSIVAILLQFFASYI